MAYADMLLDKDGHIAVVTLNAPDKLNALTARMRASLPPAVAEIAEDDNIRVVILTGAGRAFCSGADVTNMKARMEGTLPPTPRWELAQAVGLPFIDVFLKLNKPVIAAINGACVGGGLSLALTCDIRIAADNARIGAAQVLRALVPDFGMTYLLPRTVGTSKALEMMYTGEIISAGEAQQIGIVSRVIPAAGLMTAARELADKIAKQAPIPVELTKKMVNRREIEKMAYQLDLETWAQNICLKTADHRASVQAFLDKQPQPEFKGR